MVEFETLVKYIDELRSRYYKALSAFYAYEGLREIGNPDIQGTSRAEENVGIVNAYKNFFLPAKEALRVYFFLELAKLFDASNQSLHIDKVVNFSENNLRLLTVEAFKEHNVKQGREFLNNLTDEYKGIDYSHLVEIRDLIKIHQSTIEKLKTYRDKWLAHDDINKPELPDITGIELHELFELVGKILNALTSKLNSSSSMWDDVERDAKHHVNLVIDYLRRFEAYRLKEIDAEYKREIEKYSKE